MKIAKIVDIDGFQAVEFPEDFKLQGDSMLIFRHNGDIVLREMPADLSRAFELLTSFSDDFFEDSRDDT